MMDGRESVRYRAFSRRTAIVSAGTLGLFTLLTGRMFQLSVLQNDQFAMLAEDNRINLQLVAPRRGRLYDRVGVELANTAQNFRVLLVPEQTKNPRAVLEKLATLVPNLSPQRIQRVLRDIGRGKKFNPVLVVEGLSWEEFAKVNINTPDLTGIVPDVGELRSYPYGAWLSHVLGYVAGVTDKDIEKQPELLSLPGFRMGRSGVEKAADDALRGTPGASNVEVNAHGRVIRELSRREGTPGQDVVLSLDMEVQKIAQEKLAGQSGSVVVMDVETGEIISIVSAPGFDPNAFTGTVSPTIWKQLNEDELKPLLNKAITGIYPPGSTYKPIVALAALASGAMSPQARVHCSGARALGSHVFHCWKRGGHGSVDMHAAIKQSCDSYFYECARRTGIEAIAAMSRKFGLGQVYGLEIPGEKSGLMPDPAWKLRARKDSWRDGDTFNVGIGQGAVLTTPLQLCVMTARLANGGKAVMPHVIRSFGGVERVLPPPEDMGLDPAHVAIVHSGMDAVTNQGGTGARSRIDIEGFDMAGKTGTAQVRRLTADLRGRSADSIPWKFRDHALFIAFAPVGKPRYAISVVVEHGGGGSKTAAPIAKDVMTLVAQRDPARQKLFVPPSRTVAVASEKA
ncbi:MAG: penicillin-binding protein 2 [Alphaproteobacteria bacterium]|nr:penicillin-binding protein 2 [Alphaproteobacteria bacterium]